MPPHLRHLLLHRPRSEALVDHLLELLDTLDPDPEAEAEQDRCAARDDEVRGGQGIGAGPTTPAVGTPEDGEPWLGWRNDGEHAAGGFALACDRDLEEDGRPDRE